MYCRKWYFTSVIFSNLDVITVTFKNNFKCHNEQNVTEKYLEFEYRI